MNWRSTRENQIETLWRTKPDLQWVPGGGGLAVKADVCGEVEARLKIGEEEGRLLVCEAHLYGGAVQDGAAVVPAAVQLLCAHHRGGQGAGGTQEHTMRATVSGEVTREMDWERMNVGKGELTCRGPNDGKESVRTGETRDISAVAIAIPSREVPVWRQGLTDIAKTQCHASVYTCICALFVRKMHIIKRLLVQ